MTRHSHANVVFRSKATDEARTAEADSTLQTAVEALSAGCHETAADHFRLYLDRNPDHPDAWAGLAGALRRLGILAEASHAFGKALNLRPAHAETHFGLADVLRRQGLSKDALARCNAGLALNPAIGEGHIIRAAILKDLGEEDGAIADLRRVLAAHPLAAAIHILLNDMLRGFGRLDEAAIALKEALAALPSDIELTRRLAHLLVAQRRTDEAIQPAEALVALKPDDAEAHRGLAVLYQEHGRIREAFETYQKAIDLDPTFARAYTNLATLIMADHRLDLATSIFRAVVRLTPNDATAYHNLGVVLRLQGQLEEAETSFREALVRKPDYFESLVELCHIRQHFCDWDGLNAQQEALFAASYRIGRPIPPFAAITSSMSTIADQLVCARAWGTLLSKKADRVLATYAPRALGDRARRLKIGYVSTDFHNHATAMLIVELLEKHDKSRFEVFAYSFGPDDGSPLRQRLLRTFDVFVELRGCANAEAIRRIHADKLDILIDLKGYTQDARTEIFAARPAPIQVNFLGYPGTMGADFIDYMIVDAIVAPPEHAAFYDEKLVHLPNCYQPNDRKRPVAADSPTRAACNLPETGFVFCCFNNSYKITDTVFAVWMRLLHGTAGSVLWLLEPNRAVADNLRREAQTHGIAGDRIVFAPRVAADSHLARLRCADLFLDTLPVNAHTTASEALWVGLPVLTCLGDTFISRVAGSLLHAVGLPELVTTSLAAYEAKALHLAHDPETLHGLRDRLTSHRLDTPLFDTTLYARHFEAALLKMAALRDAGRKPEAFFVSDRD